MKHQAKKFIALFCGIMMTAGSAFALAACGGGDDDPPGSQTYTFAAALTDMHQYFFIASDDHAGYEEMRAYSEACTSWALDNYQGLPRGLQKGIAIYPVMLQHPIDPGALRYVLEKPNMKFAAFQLAVALDPVAGEIRYLEKTPVWGYAMWNGIKRTAGETLCV